MIEQKKAMAKLNALEEEYNIAVKKEAEARKKQVESYKELISAEDELRDRIEKKVRIQNVSNEQLYDYYTGQKSIDDLVKETGADYNSLSDALRENGEYLTRQVNHYKDASNTYKKASDTLNGYNAVISTYDKMYGLALENNYKAMNRYFEHERNLFGLSTTERKSYWEKVISDSNVGLEVLKKNQDKYTKEQYDALKKQYEDNIKLGQDYLNNLQLVMNTKNGEISNDVVNEWKKMGNKSTEEFLYFFDQLPSDAKKTLVDGMEKNKKDLSKDLQKVINEIKPTLTIDVKGNMSPFEQNVRNLASKYKNLLPAGVVDRLLDSYFKTKANGGVFNGTTWSNIPQFANGGMPRHGTIFAAGENGAEIVGNINRRTEVLNRSQIASAIYSAVASAMSQYGGGTTQVELIAHTDEGVVIDRINQKTKQTGRCPIDMPAY